MLLLLRLLAVLPFSFASSPDVANLQSIENPFPKLVKLTNIERSFIINSLGLGDSQGRGALGYFYKTIETFTDECDKKTPCDDNKIIETIFMDEEKIGEKSTYSAIGCITSTVLLYLNERKNQSRFTKLSIR